MTPGPALGAQAHVPVRTNRYAFAMATEAAPQTVESRLHAPEVTIVIPLLNEQATVPRLWEGIDRTLDDSRIAAEVIFIDDGSTDGTMALLEELHERDPRVRVVSFKRNFGQHPAMHAGIARARGRIVVTMDGDLQNQPSDIPKLVAAIHAGADVASGRRVVRRDGFFLRRVPSRYRRDAIEPVMHRIGRQKFTKALVCTTGASVMEVDLQHAARDDQSRYGMIKLVTLALHVLTGFWAQMVQWVGAVLAIGGILMASIVTLWGAVFWIRHGDFPGPLFLGGLVLFVLGLQGFLMAVLGEYLARIQRDVEQRPIYYIDRELG
jgi:glycosyltransferase involved in cell wall biosynthesis